MARAPVAKVEMLIDIYEDRVIANSCIKQAQALSYSLNALLQVSI